MPIVEPDISLQVLCGEAVGEAEGAMVRATTILRQPSESTSKFSLTSTRFSSSRTPYSPFRSSSFHPAAWIRLLLL
eukprot:764538-Hanusia_phi.AAC.2